MVIYPNKYIRPANQLITSSFRIYMRTKKLYSFLELSSCHVVYEELFIFKYKICTLLVFNIIIIMNRFTCLRFFATRKKNIHIIFYIHLMNLF